MARVHERGLSGAQDVQDRIPWEEKNVLVRSHNRRWSRVQGQET